MRFNISAKRKIGATKDAYNKMLAQSRENRIRIRPVVHLHVFPLFFLPSILLKYATLPLASLDRGRVADSCRVLGRKGWENMQVDYRDEI